MVSAIDVGLTIRVFEIEIGIYSVLKNHILIPSAPQEFLYLEYVCTPINYVQYARS